MKCFNVVSGKIGKNSISSKRESFNLQPFED